MADLLNEAMNERPLVTGAAARKSELEPGAAPPPSGWGNWSTRRERQPRKESLWPVVSSTMFGIMVLGTLVMVYWGDYATGRLHGARLVGAIVWITYYLAVCFVLVHALREGVLYGLLYLVLPLYDVYYALTRLSQIGLTAFLTLLGKLWQLALIVLFFMSLYPGSREFLPKKLDQKALAESSNELGPRIRVEEPSPGQLPPEPTGFQIRIWPPPDEPQSADNQAKAQIGLFRGALERYALDMKDYPTTEQGLRALIEKSIGGKAASGVWDGPYLSASELPRDPWGHEYHYEYPSTRGDGDRPAIWSSGPDGQSDTNDDVVSWNRPNSNPDSAR